jgi:hypothetical protein
VSGRFARFGFALLIAAAAHTDIAWAQVRDNTRIKTGTASISGIVTSAESPEKGLRRVTVMLGAGDQIKLPVNIVTDDAGRFTFSGLAAGTYTLIATRPGFVTSTYGAKVPGRAQGAPISLADGQQMSGIVLPMMHGAALSGTIRYPSGRPASEIGVIVLAVKNVAGERRLNPMLAPGRTDDRGVYRVYGLPPGDYIVRVDMSGRQDQMRPMTKDEIEWALKLQTGAGKPGGPGAPPPAPPAPQPVAYTSVYYPGVADPAAASVVALRAGEDRDGVDISCVLVPTATVSGRVFTADGQPAAGLQVRLESSGSTGGGITDLITNMMGRSGARITNDEFSIPNVPPGRYRLIARAKPPVTPGAAAPARPAAAAPSFLDIMGAMNGGGRDLTLWAEQQIEISGVDQTGLTLRLQPGLTISGRVEFETARAQPPDSAAVRIGVSPATAETGASPIEAVGRLMTGTFVPAQKDGTFVVAGLTPDRYRTMFVPPNMMMPPPLMPVQPGGFVLKSAMLNGKDIADEAIDVRQGSEIKDLVVTFTDKLSEISGTLQDAAGKPVVGFPIIVFSTNRAAWTFGSRRIAQAHPASDGTYKVQGLPAGDYYVCALTDLDPSDLYDPAFLDQLAPASFKITLADGEKKTQNLKLGGGSLF